MSVTCIQASDIRVHELVRKAEQRGFELHGIDEIGPYKYRAWFVDAAGERLTATACTAGEAVRQAALKALMLPRGESEKPW